MHPYLPHLLADIRAAHRNGPPEEETKLDSPEDYFREIDSWVSGDAEQTLGYYCGLDSVDFPPPEQFSEQEIKTVCDAFETMLGTWNATLDLPDMLPLEMRYKLTVGLLADDFTPVDQGVFVFDFCTGYAPGCELKQYCRCLEFWNDDIA